MHGEKNDRGGAIKAPPNGIRVKKNAEHNTNTVCKILYYVIHSYQFSTWSIKEKLTDLVEIPDLDVMWYLHVVLNSDRLV